MPIKPGCLSIAMLLTILSGGLASAQDKSCDPYWTGSWDTTYGQLRLIEDGDTVYGDYGNVGTIKAYLNRPCGEWLRGIFERKDGRWGYIEFVATGDLGSRFSGRWTWSDTTLPSWEGKNGTEWRGTVEDRYPPPILNFGSGETRDPLEKSPWQFEKWMTLVDKKAEQAAREQQKADQEADRQARLRAASAPKPIQPITQGLVLNDGYGSVLSVGTTFDTDKAQTAVSMQEHVQMVSSDGAGTVKDKLKDNGFTLIGDGVFEAGGLNGERLRMTMARKGSAIIVTFRGTGGDDFGETIVNAISSDARTKLISPSFISSRDTSRSVEKGLLVHKGFYDSYMKFRGKITAQLANEPKSNLFIFGHSLGGAMATLMAADMQTNYEHKFTTITHLVSGSPRVGNKPFFLYFSRIVPDNLRIAVNNDPVPLIPKRGRTAGTALQFDRYEHVGRLLVIQADGKPIDGNDMRVDLKLRTLRSDFKTYHDNMFYLNAVKKMRAKQPSNPKLSPNGHAWLYNTAVTERRRSQ